MSNPTPCDCNWYPHTGITYCPLHEAAPELLQALKLFTPAIPSKDARCHIGLTTQEKCVRCSKIIRAHAAIEKAEKQP